MNHDDPRCNCEEADCPICNAPLHRPWRPRAGKPTPEVHQPSPEDVEAHRDALGRWERQQTMRRYLIVMLMALLGGMIGGMTSALTVLYQLN